MVACIVALLAGCTTRTQYGECVGIDDADRIPTLHYKVETWNIIWAVIFFETIVVPIVVALDATYCPVGVK